MFAVIGVCSIAAGGFAVHAVKRDYNLTARQGGLLIADKLGVDFPVVRKFLEPGQRFKDYTFQGGFKKPIPGYCFKIHLISNESE